MKKLLAVGLVAIIGLTGCNAMGSMEETYNTFIETRDANGYVLTSEDLEDGTKIEFDYTSATEYSVVYSDSTSTMTMTCGSDDIASVDMPGYDSLTGSEASEYCELMHTTIDSAAAEVYENEAFFNTEYDVEYTKDDTQYIASGVYDGSEEQYSMSLNLEGTTLTFIDDTQSLSVTTK